MRKGTKQQANLNRRRHDFHAGSVAAKHDKQGDRWAAGGYHCPGSNKK